ncbi:hypothetical protein [Dysosmobacter sp. Sow4_B12]|uniref:hypothetical protein n=1 Tax=Dysosmobacter sp. Sow4_B12 TaxID=3438777 RepID=UPI003F92CDBE
MTDWEKAAIPAKSTGGAADFSAGAPLDCSLLIFLSFFRIFPSKAVDKFSLH